MPINQSQQRFQKCFDQHLKLLNRLLFSEALDSESYTSIDGDSFYQFTQYYRISGYIYQLICKANLSNAFSEQTIQRFSKDYAENSKRVGRIYEGIRSLSNCLDGEDLIFLKGPALALRFYQDINSRRSADVDIFVGEKAVERCEGRLKKNGFRPESIVFLSRNLSKKYIHHFEYKSSSLSLDLHWAFRRHFSFALDYEAIWKGSQMFSMRGLTVRTLSDEYCLVFQILSIVMDVERGTKVLRSFIDLLRVAHYLEQNGNWQAFFEKRHQERILKISLNVLDFMIALFDCKKEFPQLSQIIEEHTAYLDRRDYEARIKLLMGQTFWNNKLWASRLYDAPVVFSVCWWLLTSPFRFFAYKSGKFNILRKFFS